MSAAAEIGFEIEANRAEARQVSPDKWMLRTCKDVAYIGCWSEATGFLPSKGAIRMEDRAGVEAKKTSTVDASGMGSAAQVGSTFTRIQQAANIDCVREGVAPMAEELHRLAEDDEMDCEFEAAMGMPNDCGMCGAHSVATHA